MDILISKQTKFFLKYGKMEPFFGCCLISTFIPVDRDIKNKTGFNFMSLVFKTYLYSQHLREIVTCIALFKMVSQKWMKKYAFSERTANLTN